LRDLSVSKENSSREKTRALVRAGRRRQVGDERRHVTLPSMNTTTGEKSQHWITKRKRIMRPIRPVRENSGWLSVQKEREGHLGFGRNSSGKKEERKGKFRKRGLQPPYRPSVYGENAEKEKEKKKTVLLPVRGEDVD